MQGTQTSISYFVYKDAYRLTMGGKGCSRERGSELLFLLIAGGLLAISSTISSSSESVEVLGKDAK